MVISAIPSIIQSDHAIGPFALSLYMLAVGAALFKANIAPTVLDQNPHKKPHVITNKNGSKAIVDPEATSESIMLWYDSPLLGGRLTLICIGSTFWLISAAFSVSLLRTLPKMLVSGLVTYFPACTCLMNSRRAEWSPKHNIIFLCLLSAGPYLALLHFNTRPFILTYWAVFTCYYLLCCTLSTLA
jgi:hypothetical protein